MTNNRTGIDRAHRKVIFASLRGAARRGAGVRAPYHLGNGWFGGFLPSIAFSLIAYTGDIYSGLWYPVIVCLVTAVVGTAFLRETHGVETLAVEPRAM